jgi:hypothetical protein
MSNERREETGADIQRASEELEWLRARYDDGAVSPAMYAVIRTIKTNISWIEHQQVRS